MCVCEYVFGYLGSKIRVTKARMKIMCIIFIKIQISGEIVDEKCIEIKFCWLDKVVCLFVKVSDQSDIHTSTTNIQQPTANNQQIYIYIDLIIVELMKLQTKCIYTF